MESNLKECIAFVCVLVTMIIVMFFVSSCGIGEILSPNIYYKKEIFNFDEKVIDRDVYRSDIFKVHNKNDKTVTRNEDETEKRIIAEAKTLKPAKTVKEGKGYWYLVLVFLLLAFILLKRLGWSKK